MAVRRVFVLWTHPLILGSLRALLEHAEIEWVGESSTLINLPEILTRHNPDIVLIEGEVEENAHKAFHLLKTTRHNLRVIGLNMEGNQIQLYEIEQDTINRKEDLLKLILKE